MGQRTIKVPIFATIIQLCALIQALQKERILFHGFQFHCYPHHQRGRVKVSFAAGTGLSTQAAAASAVISLEATAKLPKGTEHYISDLHGEDEAFIHLLNSASGVIREKVDLVLGENVPKVIRAELATLIYYPARKLPCSRPATRNALSWKPGTARRCCA